MHQTIQIRDILISLFYSLTKAGNVIILRAFRLEEILHRLLPGHQIVMFRLVRLLLILCISKLLYDHQPGINGVIDALNVKKLALEPDVGVAEGVVPVFLLDD